MPYYSRRPYQRYFTPRSQRTPYKSGGNMPQTPQKPLFVHCYWCGAKYRTFEGFKYLQCEVCPWTIIESVHTKKPTGEGLYPHLRRDDVVREGHFVGRIYEVFRNRYVPLEDEKDKKKHKRGRSSRHASNLL